MPTPDSQTVAQASVHLGAVYLFAGVQESTTLGRTTLTNTVDTTGYVRSCINGYPWVVRPTTGVYLGWIEDGCEFDPGVDERGDNINGIPVESNSEVTSERHGVRGGLQMTANVQARRIVCNGAYLNSGFGISTGGLRELPTTNLLCVIVNRNDPDYTTLRFYTDGVFIPAKWTVGYNRRPIQCEYRLKRGYKPNTTCLRDLGKLIYEWEVETFTLTEIVRSYSTGAVVSPSTIWDAPWRVDWGGPRLPFGLGM